MASEPIQLDLTKVGKAVEALRKLSSTPSKGKDLLEEIQDVELQVCLKKIPKKESTVKLKLPHSIKKADPEVCLFVKDLDKTEREYEATVRHFQDVLKQKDVTSVTEIIPLKSLKTEYKPFEAKKNLSNSFDVFLADARIIRLLPSYLGKNFYSRNKAPLQVNLQSKNLSYEIETALTNSRCPISPKGSSSTAVVAHLNLEDKEITENVVASASQISANIPGGPANIKLLSVKLKQSMSIPVFIGQGGPQDVEMPKWERPDDVEAEDVSTVFGAKVKVYPNGHIKLVSDSGKTISEKPAKPVKKVVKRKGTSLRQKGGKKTLTKPKGTKKSK